MARPWSVSQLSPKPKHVDPRQLQIGANHERDLEEARAFFGSDFIDLTAPSDLQTEPTRSDQLGQLSFGPNFEGDQPVLDVATVNAPLGVPDAAYQVPTTQSDSASGQDLNPQQPNQTVALPTIASATANPPPQPLHLQPPPPRAVNRITIRAIATNAQYGALTLGRPPAHTQPPLGVDIGIIEILTFFPNWLVLPMVAMRAVHAGWGSVALAKAQLRPMGLLDAQNQGKTRAKIQKQLAEGAKSLYNWAGNFNGQALRNHHQGGWNWDLTAAG